MDLPPFRAESSCEPLNTRKKKKRRGPGRGHVIFIAVCVMVLLLAGSRKCMWRPTGQQPPAGVRIVPEEWVEQLADTCLEAVQMRFDQGRPDEALALAVALLESQPPDGRARELASRIIGQSAWHLPELGLRHPLPVEQLRFAAPACLWVGLAGEQSTVVRWDLTAPRIESVLFPVSQSHLRSLLTDPSQRRLVVERGGVLLLCDASNLKPIRGLGVLPDFMTPSAVVVFSADGLLMAHPATMPQGGVAWLLRDAASGELLRATDPLPAAPRSLAAVFDRRVLHVLQADGSRLEIPLSPIEAPRTNRADSQLALLHGLYDGDAATAIVRIDHGPHQAAELAVLPTAARRAGLMDPSALLERHSWSLQPGIWSGLLRDTPLAPVLDDDSRVLMWRVGVSAPLRAATPVTALAAGGALRIIGEKNGVVSISRMLPKLMHRQVAAGQAEPDAAALAAVRHLVHALAGLRRDADSRALIALDAGERWEAISACDFSALARLFPELDFEPWTVHLRMMAYRGEAPAKALEPLTKRLARTLAEPASPAARLAKALASEQPQAIEKCLSDARGMPPVLRKLAESRIAWLEGRKADALAGWPEVFPKLEVLRLHQDWDGWEQADFGPAFKRMQKCLEEEMAALELPENPAAEQRRQVASRLLDPSALRAVGRERYAGACLRAATVLAGFKEDAPDARQLAIRARELGAPPQPALRAEARALTALGDFTQAHERWIALITDHPVATHEAADYTEAAYTAFETGDSRQAMEILTAGLHRFPQDADFAMRAGWVSLLTGHPDRAHRFLLAGREIGFPPEKTEHALAMLAIAAAQCGFADDAAVYYQDLVGLNPEWKEQTPIDNLEWPDEMKDTLRLLSR